MKTEKGRCRRAGNSARSRENNGLRDKSKPGIARGNSFNSPLRKPDSELSEPIPYDDAWNEAASKYARVHAADRDWGRFTKTRLKVMRTRDARDFGTYLPLLLNLLSVAHEELHTDSGAYEE
jgi:hypothetical protein